MLSLHKSLETNHRVNLLVLVSVGGTYITSERKSMCRLVITCLHVQYKVIAIVGVIKARRNSMVHVD